CFSHRAKAQRDADGGAKNMKMEYLHEGSQDCPLIRLYHFTTDEARQLLAALTGLASGELPAVELHELPCVQSVGGFRLRLRANSWDAGVVRNAGARNCECVFASDTARIRPA